MKVLALIAFAFVYAAAELPMQDAVSDVRPICIDGGKIYKKGAQFYSKGCYKCTCHGANQISCLPSCPLLHVMCSPFEETKYKVHKLNKRCSCKVPYCAKKTTCSVRGKTYKVGEKFIDQKICSSCHCTDGGPLCVPLCMPMGVYCHSGQVKKYKTVKRSPKCSCKVPYCEKMAGPHIMKDAPEAENTQEEELKDESEVADEVADEEVADEEVANEEVADEEVADEEIADEDAA